MTYATHLRDSFALCNFCISLRKVISRRLQQVQSNLHLACVGRDSCHKFSRNSLTFDILLQDTKSHRCLICYQYMRVCRFIVFVEPAPSNFHGLGRTGRLPAYPAPTFLFHRRVNTRSSAIFMSESTERATRAETAAHDV